MYKCETVTQNAMDERLQSLRRGQNLVMDAEQLDRQDSLARRNNKRVQNRLRLKKGTLEDNKSTNLHSMNYEMRRLKHELKGIKQTSGYFDLGSSTETTSRTVRRTREKRTQAREKATAGESAVEIEPFESVTRNNGNKQEKCDQGDKKSKQSQSLLLPILSGTSSVRSPKSGSAKEATKDSPANVLNAGREITEQSQRTGINKPLSSDPIARAEESYSRTKRKESTGYPPEIKVSTESYSKNCGVDAIDSSVSNTKTGTASATSLGNLKMDAVKDRIQNRLTTTSQSTSYDDSDITPFMHVPPDGMPRTVYLLPPLQELLKEAKKARYIRRPRRNLEDLDPEDPERELDVDEIFSKKR